MEYILEAISNLLTILQRNKIKKECLKMITFENIVNIINEFVTKTAMLTVLFLGIALPIIIFSSLSYFFIELYKTAFTIIS